MWNMFKKPYEKETLDDWAKLSIDLAKVAILAIPVILYGEATFGIKILNATLLTGFAYVMVCAGRLFRKMKGETQ